MIDLERCADFGRAAIRAGTPDFGMNGNDYDGVWTDAGDAIANIMHALYAEFPDVTSVQSAWDRAWMHFEAEINGED